MIILPTLITVALSTYFSATGLAFLGQDYIQYRPTWEDAHGRGQEPFVPWRDERGDFLAYIRPSEAPTRVVVFFHGMGGEAMNWRWYDTIVPKDQTLVLAEYPGYGAKTGTPSQISLFGAADKLLRRVGEKWQVPITVVGESLGSGVACYVASRVRVDRLALVSPFSSIVDVVRHHVPLLPVKTLLRDQYRSLSYVKSLDIPLHILHGTSDGVIPITVGRKLFDFYPGVEKAFTELAGFDHYSINAALARSRLAEPFRRFIAGEDSSLLSDQ